MQYRIAIGTDHRGFELKKELLGRRHIGEHEVLWQDVGTFSKERTDYPQFAKAVVRLMLEGEADLGILSCGTGIGIAVAANRFTGIYAGVVWNEAVARMAKEDDNINVLVIPADFMNFEEAIRCIDAWLTADFKGGRYQERLEQIEKKEGEEF